MSTELEIPPTPRFEVCCFCHGERRRKACMKITVILAFGHALRAHEALSRPYTLPGFLEVVHRLFGSCGPTYEPPNMRRHQDRGSERFGALSSRAEGVSLRIVSVGVSRSAAARAGLRPGKLARALRSLSRAFRRRSESSVICSRVRCI
jgi:hypothetical protein